MYSSQPFVGPPSSPSYRAGLTTISGLVLFGMGVTDPNNNIRIPCSIIGSLLLCLSCYLCARRCASSKHSQGIQGAFLAVSSQYDDAALDVQSSI